MKQRLLTSVFILAWFLPLGLFVPGKPVQPGAPQGIRSVYLVEWNITARGNTDFQGADYRKVVNRQFTINGQAYVREQSNGAITTLPMDLIITDHEYRRLTRECTANHEWTDITDPGRYSGGPDPFWGSGVFDPHQATDGSWSMDNPLSDWSGFANSGQLYRYFNYRTDQKNEDLCGSHDYAGTSNLDSIKYSVILKPLRDLPLRGDPTGKFFSLSTSYSVNANDVTLQVSFHASVRNLGGCKDLAGPIDINNPGLPVVELDLQAEDTTPDEQADLQARVTCQGVPVSNAPVEVTLNAKEFSGGHNHDDGRRPRGYINDQEITEANPSVTAKTGSDGTVTFKVSPGRDLTDKTRGIAGWYIADAKVLHPNFTPAPTAQAAIHAHYPLATLPIGDPRFAFDNSDFSAHDPYYGTAATVKQLDEAADLWERVQDEHNLVLESKGKDPWLITPLCIYAVSLPEGGLFDGVSYPQKPWRPPFSEHRTGVDVLFGGLYKYLDSREEMLWYTSLLRGLGQEYGTWFTDLGYPTNLKMTSAPAGRGNSSPLARRQRPTAGPDPAAFAALVDPTARLVAGAGQVVTYTVGVQNLAAGTQASGVTLSAALPGGLSFSSANPAPSRMLDPRTPAWDIPSLPDEGEPRPFDILAQVDPAVAAGTLLTLTASVTSSSPDADPANNQFVDWGLTVQPPGADLVVGSDLGATALTAGQPVTFTAWLNNAGNAPAAASWLALAAPAGISLTQTTPPATAIPGGVRWEAGLLAPGATQPFTISLQADPALLDSQRPLASAAEALQFTLTAGSTGSEIDPASNQLLVDKPVTRAAADLLVGLLAQGTPGVGVFQAGQVVTYTLSYANFGNQDAAAVSAALQLWPGLALLEAQPAPTANQVNPVSGVRTLTWDLGGLAPGGAGAIQLRLKVEAVPEAGSILVASLSSRSPALNPGDTLGMEPRYAASGPLPGGRQVFLPLVSRR